MRVIVYPTVFTNLAVFSNPALDGPASFFNYTAPAINTVVAFVLGNSTDEIALARSLLGPVRDCAVATGLFAEFRICW